VKILLDTHTFLWFISGNPQLSDYARGLIEDLSNERLLSIASLWEMSIKASIGKLNLSLPFTKIVSEHITGNAIELLQIIPEHLDCLRVLPFHHRDPFDRLIIAQGQSGKIPILSKDEVFAQYDVECFWEGLFPSV
jgi:PIN domain nuclease of toxin-antitoxin system